MFPHGMALFRSDRFAMMPPMIDDADPAMKDDAGGPPPGPGLAPGPGPGLDGPPRPQASPAPAARTDAYRVLARKYRPRNFDELIGQEALVRTLTNAIEAGRIAQAFMLTGVRGVGKTTTARIVAKALNCIGPDGTGGPTAKPCDVCQHCAAIAGDRHVDVIEMDAASRNGVDDIRDLIDGVRYRPVSARYKVYVLDEVHMLSKPAFNALLKTLEEPPEHVKFVFATTEIRKVPVTVLSRCQRFDLRRVSADQLARHFRSVAAREAVEIEDEALGMVARAADGSVRDGLSILDQAIALGAGTVTGKRVRDMLGLADRGRVYDLLDAVMRGDTPGALGLLEQTCDGGTEPTVVIEDLLDATHFLTRAILVPEALGRPTMAELERTRGREMAKKLTLPILSRAWQMLMKGLGEVRAAPAPIQAAEMVLIRLIHIADMPTPGELVETLKGGAAGAGGPPRPPPGAPPGHPPGDPGGGASTSAMPAPTVGAAATAAVPATTPQHAGMPTSLPALIALLGSRKETRLATHLKHDVHLVSLEPGRLEFRPEATAPPDLHGQVGKVLSALTGARWIVCLSNAQGADTLAEQEARKRRNLRAQAERNPLVQEIKRAFPGAQITRVTPREDETDPAGIPDSALPGGPPIDPEDDLEDDP